MNNGRGIDDKRINPNHIRYVMKENTMNPITTHVASLVKKVGAYITVLFIYLVFYKVFITLKIGQVNETRLNTLHIIGQ